MRLHIFSDDLSMAFNSFEEPAFKYDLFHDLRSPEFFALVFCS